MSVLRPIIRTEMERALWRNSRFPEFATEETLVRVAAHSARIPATNVYVCM
jgi:hypothetical protein